MRNISKILFLSAVIMLGFSSFVTAVDRFPRPDFTETKHQHPVVQHVQPRPAVLEYVDTAVLLACLILAVLALRSRSRRNMSLLALFSVIYFGFYKQGCVCSVGSLQNMTQAIFQSDFFIPLVVVLFFVLPLIFALFFGRVFCAAVCPLGSLQETLLIKPVKVPVWLEKLLRFIPYLYLSFAILLAATGTAYIICQFDPFVSLYRMNGSFNMLVLTGSIIGISLFVGRPYCRFICPYSVLLNLCSKFSSWHTAITPDKCVRCGLCKDACPYGAIRFPEPEASDVENKKQKRLLKILLLIWPFLIIVGAGAGLFSAEALSHLNKTVERAESLSSGQKTPWQLDLVTAFRQTGAADKDLYAQATRILHQFEIGSTVIGGGLGFLLGLYILRMNIRRRQDDYLPDRGLCFSCGRCHAYCPREQLRLKKLKEENNAG
ncbi:MAG TPA: 4Fe-4S ferredoxin [Lentisphaeria bacterium]|nr:MAG: hypothetical protein A2X48_02235 [Lentisphaerae bacterium GWF2_49_21]HBC86020.1 4Fe-4S ferredoxin [Lentisphaeria bacterium]